MRTSVGTLVVEPGARRIRARRALRPIERLIGLVAQPLPAAGAGLWIEPCRAVHTFGVRGALDLVFVAPRGAVLRICEHVAPCSARAEIGARAVLELRAGEIHRIGLRPGMHLRWIDDSQGGDERCIV